MPYTLTFSVDVPSFSPGGDYSLTAYVWGEHGSSTDPTHLACLDVTFSLWEHNIRTVINWIRSIIICKN